MMDQGRWIKVHRGLLDNPYMDRPAYLSVWIHLLLRAEFKSGRSVLFRGERIVLQAGQLTCGREQLSRWTGVSESTAKRILDCFENEQQIEQQKSNKCTLITIRNWESYQKVEHQNEQQMNNKWTTNEQQMNTIEEVKNIRTKEKKKTTICRRSSQRPVFSDDSQEMVLASHLFSLMRQNNPSCKDPPFQSWCREFDLLLRVDKRSPEQIRTLIDWTQRHPFWGINILSPSSLRKHWDRLVLQLAEQHQRTSITNYGTS